MINPFSGHQTGLESPATHAFAITPSDSEDLPTVARGIYVGTSTLLLGDIRVTMAGDAVPVTLRTVPQGTILPVVCKKVHATGTTASDLIGLY